MHNVHGSSAKFVSAQQEGGAAASTQYCTAFDIPQFARWLNWSSDSARRQLTADGLVCCRYRK